MLGYVVFDSDGIDERLVLVGVGALGVDGCQLGPFQSGILEVNYNP
jgi:hypothetical protein